METNSSKILRFLLVLDVLFVVLFSLAILSYKLPSKLQVIAIDKYVIITGILLIFVSIVSIFLSVKNLKTTSKITLSIILLLVSVLSIFSPVILYMIKNSEIYKNNQSTALRNQAVKKLQKININDLKDQYKTINQSFSKFVTISGYETKYIDDSKEILILTYQEVPFATYINEGWPGTFESPRNEGTLKNLTGKKVSVLVPPFDMFAQTYVASEKEVGNKPIFYAKTEFDEYDLEWSLEQYELTKASKVLTKEVSINPENNLKNLYLLNDYSQDIDKLSSFDDKGVYASKRQKELCEFFSQPKTVLSVGYIKSNDEWGHPFDNYYVTVSGLPNSQIFIDTPSGLLQKIGAGPSDADINKGLLWLKGIVTKFNPEIDLQNICNESFSLNFSDYEHSIFEKDYPIPILERFWVAHAFMRKVSQQEVGVWGQLWKQGWNPLTQ